MNTAPPSTSVSLAGPRTPCSGKTAFLPPPRLLLHPAPEKKKTAKNVANTKKEGRVVLGVARAVAAKAESR
ncbi:unnamed protein product [Ectocarpus sp. 6 AP-2014]